MPALAVLAALLADKVTVIPKPLPEDTWRIKRTVTSQTWIQTGMVMPSLLADKVTVTSQTGIQTGMVMPSLLADKVTVVTDMDTDRQGDAITAGRQSHGSHRQAW